MKKLSKILVPVLLLALVFTLVTVVAFAEGEEAQIGEQKYATLADAMTAAQAGDTITLLKDVTLPTTGQFQVNKQLTVDLAGHKITWSAGDGQDGDKEAKNPNPPAFVVNDGGDLTVTSSGETKGTIAIDTNERLVSIPSTNTVAVKVTLNNLVINHTMNQDKWAAVDCNGDATVVATKVDWTHVSPSTYGNFLRIGAAVNVNLTVEDCNLVGQLNNITVKAAATINANFKNSTITADSTRVTNDKKQGMAVCFQLEAMGNTNSVFNFENCKVSSGYRTLALGNNTQSVQFNFNNCEVRTGPKLDSKNQNALLFRGCPTVTFTGACKIWLLASDKTAWTSGGTSTITVGEGTLCNVQMTGGTSTLAHPKGMNVIVNTDPATKAEWPYVVAPGNPLPTVKLDQDFTGKQITTSSGGGISGNGASGLMSSGIKQGAISVVKNADGNYYYKFATDGVHRADKANGGDGKYDAYNGISAGFMFASNSYLVADWDFMAEDSYFDTYFQVNIRNSANPPAFANQNVLGPTITANADGSAVLSHKSADEGNKEYKKDLKVNTWYHITVAFKVDKTDVTKSMLVWFLNGEYIGSQHNVVKAGAVKIDLVGRWSITSNKLEQPGKSMCLDNLHLVFYTRAFDQIENTVFCTADGQKPTLVGFTDAVWSEDYQLPNGKVFASVTSGENSKYYYSFDEALAAAKDGDTLTLYTNVTGQYPVTKAIKIVKNGYSASAANFYSSTTDDTATVYNITDTAEELTFAVSTAPATVAWCYNGNDVDYELEYYGIGNTPSYKGTNVVLAKMVDGKAYLFTGWNDSADGTGSAPGTIPAEMAGDVYFFYPVYTEVVNPMYAVKEGDVYVSFGTTASALGNAISSAKSGQTVHLMADVVTDQMVTVSGNIDITLDMNGHSWKTVGTKMNSFSIQNGATLRVINGSIFNKATDRKSDGKAQTNGGPAFYMNNAKVYLNGVNIYAALVADMNSGAKVYINGGEFYRCVPDYSAMFVLRSGNCVVDATKAYFAGGINGGNTVIIDCRDNSSGRYTLTFNNCFIGGAGNWDGNLFAQVYDVDVTFTSCYIMGRINGDNNKSGDYTITVGYQTACSNPIGNLTVTVAEGIKKVSINQAMPVSHRYCVYGTAIVDGVYVPNYTVSEYESVITFPYGYISADAPTATVIFKNGDQILATEEYMIGGNVVYTGTAPAGTPTNGFFSYTFSGFDGVTKITEAGEYVKQAQFVALTADVQGMKYNLSLYSNFVVNLYVPKDERIVALRNTAEGENLLGEVVTIGGKQYYAVRVGADVNKVSTAVTLYVTVSDGENQATQAVKLTITSYAEAVLQSETLTNADKTLMMAMLSYAQQATKLVSGTEDAAIAAILANEAYAAYIPAAKTVSGTVQDVSGLAEYIESAQLNLDEQPDFRFNIKSGVTYTVTASYVNAAGETVTATAKDGVLSVNTMRLYEFANDITITVKDGETVVATGTYNLATYLAGSGVDAGFSAAIATYVEICKAYKA